MFDFDVRDWKPGVQPAWKRLSEDPAEPTVDDLPRTPDGRDPLDGRDQDGDAAA